jgi:hypothetical protein
MEIADQRLFAIGAMPFIMSGQLIPSPETAPPSIKHLPFEKRIELWYELLDENEAFLLSGLRAKIGPDGDLHAAYREWYARRMAEHDQMLAAFAANLNRRLAHHPGLGCSRKPKAYLYCGRNVTVRKGLRFQQR